MTEQEKRENVIKALEICASNDGRECVDCPYVGCSPDNYCFGNMAKDALALLKAQEKATIEPKRIELEEETKAWLNDMDAVDALGNIADICIDWDGYRTADGLGGLVNEIWAYARYCADRLLKAQEPRAIKNSAGNGICPGCGHIIPAWSSPNYCGYCGQAVKWK